MAVIQYWVGSGTKGQSCEQQNWTVHEPWSVKALCGSLVGVVGGGQQFGGPGVASPTGGRGGGQKSWYEGFSCGANSDLPFWGATFLAGWLGRVMRPVVLGAVVACCSGVHVVKALT